ncbi:hypothetical protein ACR1PO_15670 [Chryseobacterium sp. RRHN12]|uniref:hypothetical protein n=1 Tax=Chryseobacterium sp. RRHN12 TaxID=3437884 RepID=UPI003D9B45C9
MEKEIELLDHFAGQALQALISKMPFYDVNGEYGEKLTQDELTVIKEGIAATAYEYASYMLIKRKDSLKWIDKNESFFKE